MLKLSVCRTFGIIQDHSTLTMINWNLWIIETIGHSSIARIQSLLMSMAEPRSVVEVAHLSVPKFLMNDCWVRGYRSINDHSGICGRRGLPEVLLSVEPLYHRWTLDFLGLQTTKLSRLTDFPLIHIITRWKKLLYGGRWDTLCHNTLMISIVSAECTLMFHIIKIDYCGVIRHLDILIIVKFDQLHTWQSIVIRFEIHYLCCSGYLPLPADCLDFIFDRS